MTAAATFTCPACGYPSLSENPRGASGGGSYEVCSSCGFEFGVTDDDEGHTYESWRAAWIDKGMPWFAAGVEAPPAGWNPRRQLDDLLDHP